MNRFARGTFREGLSQDCGSSCSSFYGFILSSWFPSQTLVSLCILGQDRVTDFLSFTDSFEDRGVLRHCRRISILHGAVCAVLEIAVRLSCVVVAPGSWWSTLDEDSSPSSLERLVFPECLGLGQTP